MRVAYVIPCRNKADRVARSVDAALAQTYEPLEIVLSDQCSTDGSKEVLDKIKAEYVGPHTITRLDCPLGEAIGMHGLNVHLNWIGAQIDADIIICMSADDMATPDRTQMVVDAFKEFNADFVMNGLVGVKPDGEVVGINEHPKESGFITGRQCVEGYVGGSTGHAWKTSFLKEIGGFQELPGFDSYVPFIACSRGTAYYIHKQSTIYVNYTDANNTGLEGVMRAADTPEKKLQVEEIMFFELCSAAMAAVKGLDKIGIMAGDDRQAAYERLLNVAVSWCKAREKLTLAHVDPVGLRA